MHSPKKKKMLNKNHTETNSSVRPIGFLPQNYGVSVIRIAGNCLDGFEPGSWLF